MTRSLRGRRDIRTDKKNISRNLIFILFVVLLIPIPAHPMSTPPMSKKEEGSFVVSDKEGGTRWKADWTSEEIIENGETRIKTVVRGQGIKNPFTREMRWESVSLWKSGDSFTPVESSTEVRDLQGKLVMADRTAVDEKTGAASFVREDYESNGSVSKTYETDSDVLIVEGLALALRSLPFGTDEAVKAQFLTNEPELYNIEFKQKGVETIKTAGGEVECYKVELVPKLGALNVFKVFFPKTYFWFTVASPHRWVRYDGFENGRKSPEVVMQAVPAK